MQQDRWTDKHGEANTFLQLSVTKKIAINICCCTQIIWRLCIQPFSELDTLFYGTEVVIMYVVVGLKA
jgi:hypothetical protein